MPIYPKGTVLKHLDGSISTADGTTNYDSTRWMVVSSPTSPTTPTTSTTVLTPTATGVKRKVGNIVYEQYRDEYGSITEKARPATVGEIVGTEQYTSRGEWRPLPSEALAGMGTFDKVTPSSPQTLAPVTYYSWDVLQPKGTVLKHMDGTISVADGNTRYDMSKWSVVSGGTATTSSVPQSTSINPTTTPTTSTTPTPTPTPASASAPTPTTAGQTYTVKQGDTLSAIAAKTGVPLATLKSLNPQLERGKNFNLIYPGDIVKLPSSTSIIPIGENTGITATSQGLRTAEQEAKDKEMKDLAEKTAAQIAEEESLARQKRIADLKKELGIEDLTKPALPQYQTTYEALRSEYGIAALESKINDLNSQIKDTEASLREGLYNEEGKLAPMELIGTRQRELQRQAQEKLDALNRDKQTLVDEYQTKLNIIQTTMNLKQMDYQTALADYQNNFNLSLKLYDMVLTEENEEKKIAEANLNALSQIVETGIKNGTINFSSIPGEMMGLVNKLELKLGYMPGLTVALWKAIKPDKEVLAHIVSADKTKVSILYKDGTVDTFSTGLPAELTTEEKKSSDWDKARKFIEDNPDASYEQLNTALRQYTNLSDSDIKSLLDEAGKKPKEEWAVTKEWLKENFGEEFLTNLARSNGYAKWYLPKSSELDNYLNDLVKRINEKSGTGKTFNEVLEEEGLM